MFHVKHWVGGEVKTFHVKHKKNREKVSKNRQKQLKKALSCDIILYRIKIALIGHLKRQKRSYKWEKS